MRYLKPEDFNEFNGSTVFARNAVDFSGDEAPYWESGVLVSVDSDLTNYQDPWTVCINGSNIKFKFCAV